MQKYYMLNVYFKKKCLSLDWFLKHNLSPSPQEQVILIQSINIWSSFKIIHKFLYTSNINLFLRLDLHQIIFSFLLWKVIFPSLGSISPVIAGKSHLLLRSQCFKHSWVSVVTARLPTVRMHNRPNLSASREIYVQTHSL